jgi:hypothetical protein
MKVGIKGKGAEIDWLDPNKLIVDDKSLIEHLESQEQVNANLQNNIDKLAEVIASLKIELEKAKLENIEVIKGVISR